jgi:hypothetical protein
MASANGLIEVFRLRVVGAKAYVMLKKDLKLRGKPWRQGSNVSREHCSNDARLSIRQKEIAFSWLLRKICDIMIERFSVLAPRVIVSAS